VGQPLQRPRKTRRRPLRDGGEPGRGHGVRHRLQPQPQGAANDDSDYATIAYSAATGRQLWVSRYNGPGNGFDAATSAAVSPSGASVYVTGTSTNRAGGGNFATIAYHAATGRQLWVSRSDLGGEADSVAVSRAGTTIYVTGRGNGYATIAYRAATGRQLWASTYHGPKHNDGACCVAVNQAGTKVFVSGNSEGRISDLYTTIAYRG
jgi:DNA-binding beta-propeller fold protein YncE